MKQRVLKNIYFLLNLYHKNNFTNFNNIKSNIKKYYNKFRNNKK